MKKSRMLCGIVLLLIGSAAAVFAAASNARSERIAGILKQRGTDSEISLPEPERSWLDLNGDGEITRLDLLRAKLDALLHRKTETQFIPASAAKQLGRTVYHADTGTLWCSHSGTGIECTVYGDACEILLTADSARQNEASAARYAVYADGILYQDALLTEPERTLRLPVSPDGTRIRVVKLSESMQSNLGIGLIRAEASKAVYRNRNGSLLAPAEDRAHLIEFIGDSITCGYGVDGEYGKDTFCTGNENAEKAYAMRTADLLDADYSLVCFSGHGVLSGFTSPDRINTADLVPKYYGKLGRCAATFEDKRRISEDLWDFSRQPDLVVINLGTNDSAYTGTDPEKQRQFTEAYLAFLKTVRKKNPDAPILCALGIMGQTLCDAAAQAAAQFAAETGDSRIRFLRFDVQDEADGLGVDWHPSAKTHEKAAQQLSGTIREWLGW